NLGGDVRNHASAIDDDAAARLRELVNGAPAPAPAPASRPPAPANPAPAQASSAAPTASSPAPAAASPAPAGSGPGAAGPARAAKAARPAPPPPPPAPAPEAAGGPRGGIVPRGRTGTDLAQKIPRPPTHLTQQLTKLGGTTT